MVRRTSSLALAALILAFMSSCGGEGSSSPTTPPTPAPTPTPVPQPTPTPAPEPTPNPECRPGGDCSGNRTPVVFVRLRLYRLFDNTGAWVLPTPDPTRGKFQEKFPVGFTIVLDVTGRDAQNYETNGVTGDGAGIEYFFSDPSLVQFAGNPAGNFQHKYLLTKPGTFEVYVGFDGVGSGTLTFEVVPCTPPAWGCKAS